MKNINSYATHPLQALEWGEFRKKTGVKIIATDKFQLSIHKVPKLPFNIGYLPKGPLPDKKMLGEILDIGKKERCIFIQLEPNVEKDLRFKIEDLRLKPAAHPLFTQYSFVLDLTKSEEELLKNMHSKTRYNIRVAQKHGVTIVEDNSDKAFEEYLKLTSETTKRQRFFAHTEKYHRLMWETLKPQMANGIWQMDKNKLTARLLLANYKPSAISGKPITLVAWILFVFKDTLYYPYGASSSKYKETMASNLMMWEAIKFGKKLGLKKFDMWGALGHQPSEKDPWYGFHRFKQGYGPELVEFIGSYDLVINQPAYELYKIADKIRWAVLELFK